MTPAHSFTALLHLVGRHLGMLRREPTPTECPNWCLLRQLDDAGTPVDDTDPLIEIAFWEFQAWAAEQEFGEQEARHFARLCRAYANDVLAGVAA